MQNYIEIGPVFLTRRFLKVFLLVAMATSFPHGFQFFFDNFQSVSPKDQSYEIWLKLA